MGSSRCEDRSSSRSREAWPSGPERVQAGIAGEAALTAQLFLNVDDGDGPPAPIRGESGSVRLEGITDEGGPRMVLDAVLQGGTTVRGSMQLAWCEPRERETIDSRPEGTRWWGVQGEFRRPKAEDV